MLWGFHVNNLPDPPNVVVKTEHGEYRRDSVRFLIGEEQQFVLTSCCRNP